MSTHNHTPDDRLDRRDHDCHDHDRHEHDRHEHGDHRDSHRTGRRERDRHDRDGSTGRDRRDSNSLSRTPRSGSIDSAFASGPLDSVAESDDTTGGAGHTDDGGPGNADDPGHPSRAGRRSGAKSAAPSYPDARTVGQHLVIDRTEWVPGRHPETHLGYDGQRGYAESYYRCIRCGAERQSERDFPPACDPDD